MLAEFILVNMHDLADPIDAARGILRLAVPNAPAQTFDLVDDHGLCPHDPGQFGVPDVAELGTTSECLGSRDPAEVEEILAAADERERVVTNLFAAAPYPLVEGWIGRPPRCGGRLVLLRHSICTTAF